MAASSERFVFLHGFTQDGGVGGGGQIAKYVASLFHVTVDQPNLNQPSFNEFSVSNAIKVIDQLYEEKQTQMNLIGASMGGYIAARYAELHPDRVKKLFLLCPAFGLAARWREFVSADELENWKASGSYAYDGRQLHYAFFQDISENHPAYPQVSCPTSIVHGKADRLVPIEASRTFIKEQKTGVSVQLVEETRRQAAVQAADRRIQQAETRGVDENELRRMKNRQTERERIEQRSFNRNDNTGALKWQMN